MKRLIRHSALVCLAAIICRAQPAAAQLPERVSIRDAMIQSAAVVEADGRTISSPSYTPQAWFRTRIPSTVLRSLVNLGVYPDPHVGMNNMRIPDASDAFNERFDLARFSHLPGKANPWSEPWWYRAEFQLPERPEEAQAWLVFEGINYRADVWLNGQKIADYTDMVGMFERFILPASEAIRGGRNVLAVSIHPLDTPGLPADPQLSVFGPFGPNGGPSCDIGKNVTMQSSAGWDWMPAARDRNMGIWQDVYLAFTGPVDLRFPHVVTDLPLPATSPARISVSAELWNTSTETVHGTLEADILHQGQRVARIRQEVALEPGIHREVTLTPDQHADLILQNPLLWWPNGYGDPNLYELDIRFRTGSGLSDREELRFGVREVGSRFATIDGWHRREFTVNGQDIEIKGGAWVPDMMLARDRQRLLDELRLSREAHFNMVRIWGGGVTPPAAFFDLTDELGLLVWHDFWITGDCQGTWDKGTRDWPLEGDVFVSNAVDTAKRLRNHPSLLAWSAGNEGYPRRELYRVLRDEIAARLDGTRPFLPTSGFANPDPSWGLSWPDDHETGAYSGGPYHWVEPAEYFRLAAQGQDWLFKDEVGLPSVPPLASLQRFLPDLDPASDKLTDSWGYHDAAEGNGRYSLYHQAIGDRYGTPKNLAEYAWKAQFVNAENYRAIFAAANVDLDRTSGVILWKTNAAWPSVIWQVYDWYLRPNAGYYFARKASQPLSVLLQPGSYTVSAVNVRPDTAKGLTLVVVLFDRDGQRVGSTRRTLSLAAHQSREILHLSELEGWTGEAFRFARLWLENQAGEQVADGFYWLAPNDDFSVLNELPEVELAGAATKALDGDSVRFTLSLSNPGAKPAFFVHPAITLGPDGDEVLPTFWSDNYFSLMPGERKTVAATVDRFRLEGIDAAIRLDGWNVKKARLPVSGQE